MRGDIVIHWECETGWAHAGVFDGSKIWFLTFTHLVEADAESLARRAARLGWRAVHIGGTSAAPHADHRADHEPLKELWLRPNAD
jgi:hypothetical protein